MQRVFSSVRLLLLLLVLSATVGVRADYPEIGPPIGHAVQAQPNFWHMVLFGIRFWAEIGVPIL